VKIKLLATTAALVALTALSAGASEYKHRPPERKPPAPTSVYNTTNHNKTTHESRSTSSAVGQGGAASAVGQGGAASASGQGGSVSTHQEGDKNEVWVPPGLALAGSGDCVESFSVSILLGGFARSYRCTMLNLVDALRAQYVYGDSRDPHVQALLAAMRREALGSEPTVDVARDRGGEMN
jgi:hypothetical protein